MPRKDVKAPLGGEVPTRERGFTLIELAVVIMIIVVVYALPITRRATTQYWREEGMIRRLSETITLLHHQAVIDDVYYRMEFNLGEQQASYRVGEIVPEGVSHSSLSSIASAGSGVGFLSQQLAMLLNPSTGKFQNMIPPRSFPSLAEPVRLVRDTYFADLITMRGRITEADSTQPYIMFSPRGFSEFAVIHVQLSEPNNKVTILVNPFTGLTDIYRAQEFKDFEWTYGRKKK